MPPAAAHAMSSTSPPGTTKLPPLATAPEKTADFNKILGALDRTTASPAAFSSTKVQAPPVTGTEAAVPKSAPALKPSDPKAARTPVVAVAAEMVPAVPADPLGPFAAAGPGTEAAVPPPAPLTLAPVKAAPKSAPATKSSDPAAAPKTPVVLVGAEIVPAVPVDLPVPVAPAAVATAVVAPPPVPGRGSAVIGTIENSAKHDGTAPAAVTSDTPAPGTAKASVAPAPLAATAPADTQFSATAVASAPHLPSAVVANHAQALSPAASVVAAHTPVMQLRTAIVSIAAGAGKTGQHSVTVQLAPIELGKVQITLIRDSSGATTVTVSADRSDTLALLSRDQSALQHSLDKAGVPAEGRSLSFNLSGQSEGGGGPADTRHAAESSRSANDQFVAGDDAAEPVSAAIPFSRAGLINITA